MVMELEELKKLKVQDLKNELAKYNLSQVGKKDELLARLSEHLAKNTEQADDDDELAPPDEGQYDEEFTKLLGTTADNHLLSSLSTTPALPTGQAAAPPPQHAAGQKEGAKLSSPTSTQPAKVNSPPLPAVPAPSQGTGTSAAVAAASANGAAAATAKSATSSATPVVSASDEERKRVERANRFGIPVPLEVKKKERAARFGESLATKPGASATQNEMEKKKAERAARFGTSSSSTTPTQAPAKPVVPDQKLADRAMRFGLQSTDNTKRPSAFGERLAPKKPKV